MFWRKKEEEKQEESPAFVLDTNMVLRIGQLGGSSIFNSLKGQVFVPWAVLEELLAFRKEAIYVKRYIQEHGREPDFMSRMRQVERLTRRRRHKSILNAWPLFSQKIEDGEWRIVGSNSKLYFQTENGDSELGSADTRILAACKALQERGFKVVLLTRDKKLREKAQLENINAEEGLSNLFLI